jgi:hypothetical protein
MIPGPGCEERGSTLRDDPGILARTSLDQATAVGLAGVPVADVEVGHGAVSVSPSVDPVTPGSMIETIGLDRLQRHGRSQILRYDR